jgi:hypothetical protein
MPLARLLSLDLMAHHPLRVDSVRSDAAPLQTSGRRHGGGAGRAVTATREARFVLRGRKGV